jgi:Uncharacterized conserved protein (DUF2183)
MGRLIASLSVVLVVTLASTLVFATPLSTRKVLLVSDIDDTIKVSHVLSTAGKVSRAADITTPFTGMAQLYQWIKNMNPTTTQIVYLSNAPEKIAGIPALKISHETFLRYNDFPEGDVTLREDILNPNHKLTTIRTLIDETMPELVIMVGDNGERDNEVYHQIFEEYKNTGIKMVSFIHQLYATKTPFYKPDFLAEVGKPIFSEQIGFVTPVEVALELKDQEILNEEALTWMIQRVAPYIVNETTFKWDGLKPITFPFFSSCTDFKWRWTQTVELAPLIKKLRYQCN